jgi:hypothetical protein
MTDLSLDDAAALAANFDDPAPEAAPAPAKAEPAKAKEPAEPAAPEGEEDDENQELPEDDADAEAEVEDEGEDDDTDPEGVPAVEAPTWWDAEAQKHFASLPPEAQAIVREQEEKREAVVQKVKEKAKEATDTAKAEVTAAKALSDRLAAALPDQRKAFDDYYGDIDWPEYARQDPQAAQVDWFNFQQGKQSFENAEAARAEAQKLASDNWTREQSERLQVIAPELAAKPETLKALADYLPTTGIPAENLREASAEELVILDKARRFDLMMAKAAAKPSDPPRQKTTTPPAKVPPQGQARTPSTTQQRETQRLSNRLDQTRSRDDAAELITKYGY